VERHVDFAYRTELPALPRQEVTRYHVWVCQCIACGNQVHGQQPALAADQYGATAHRLRLRVRAVAKTFYCIRFWPGRTGAAFDPVVFQQCCFLKTALVVHRL
jgi:hypothetical protein